MQSYLKIVALPLTLFIIFLIFFLIWKISGLPNEKELTETAKEYFEKYGLITVFVSAILEGMLLVGLYYPGSLVIFLGVIFAGDDIMRVTETVIVVTAGLYIAYLISFMLGKYGWHKLLLAFGMEEQIENAKKRLTKYGLGAIMLCYWHPNLAAVTATAAGTLDYSLRKFLFYSTVSVVLWSTFWGTVAYFMGEAALALMGLRFALIVIIVWIIFAIIRNKRIQGKNQKIVSD